MPFSLTGAEITKTEDHTYDDILKETASAREWDNFPKNGFVIAQVDGETSYLLLLPEGNENSTKLGEAIYLWHHEMDFVVPVADSITALERC